MKHQLICNVCGRKFQEFVQMDTCLDCVKHPISTVTIRTGEALWQSVAPAAARCQDDGRKPGIHTIYNDPKAYCYPKIGLWIVGPARVGKTWLAYRCLRTFARIGLSIKVLKTAELNGATETVESLRDLKTVGALLVDDFDKALFNERNTQLLFAIIDARGEAGLRTIITANRQMMKVPELLPPALQRFSDSFVGRFQEQYKEVIYK